MAGHAAPRHLFLPAAQARQRFGAARPVRGAAGPAAVAVVISSEDATTLARMEAAREEFPDGSYGGPRGARPDPQAAEHVQELTEALEDWRVGPRGELMARADRLTEAR